ncbi:unnamed protein product [Adineta ricciae]|uniref:Uncharacterized protein n=1 Tax=Adineta ricciae TaxID=249248 RepID=A0A815RGG2_ADIRI|nr:unnamed protein product [Adineta ricciae]
MIARQVKFVFVSLLFVFVINISSAPVPDDQLITKRTVTSATSEPINYDTDIDKSESNETSMEENTTTFATIQQSSTTVSDMEVVTKDYPLIISHLLAFDVAEILNGTDPFPVESEMGLPATPTTDFPQWIETNTMVYEQIDNTN